MFSVDLFPDDLENVNRLSLSGPAYFGIAAVSFVMSYFIYVLRPPPWLTLNS